MVNNLSILHDDDFLKEKVEMSTFTATDDILLKIKKNLMIFDKH